MPKPGRPAAQSMCPSQAPSPACPLTHVSVAMGCPITGSTWHLATPSSLLLSLLSPSPPHRPHWGVHNEVSHLHSGSNKKWSKPRAWSSCCINTVWRMLEFWDSTLEDKYCSCCYRKESMSCCFFVLFWFSLHSPVQWRFIKHLKVAKINH